MTKKTKISANQYYTRHTSIQIELMLPILQRAYENDPSPSAKLREDVGGKIVKVTGLRLGTFATKGCVCSTCGLEASFFAIETQANAKSETWHINLWGVKDGEEVLFTHDHTLARSGGGKNNLNNTTTMCSPCNKTKSLTEHL